MGLSKKLGVPYFGVLIIWILLIKGTILGSPIVGSSHMDPKIPLSPTCIPKPYKIVGYDPLIRESNP